MKILVVNSGSSSIKYKVIDEPNSTGNGDSAGSPKVLGGGLIERIGLDNGRIIHKVRGEKVVIERDLPDHGAGIGALMEVLQSSEYGLIESLEELKGAGHRVVHGGERYDKSVVINEDVMDAISDCVALAPLHNPANLAGIKALEERLPELPQVAVFDTAFHQTMPQSSYLYGLPYGLYEEHKIRKYGFHGSSHAYVTHRFGELTKNPRPNLVVCHLGNGASLCAVAQGKSVDTSMGFTPLDGLLMGTRTGTLDPAVVLYLLNQGRTVAEVDRLLNKESGVKGVSGISSDMREIEDAYGKDPGATRAFDLFCHRVRHYLGAYMTLTGPLDGVVFTGGIGENSPIGRSMILQGLEHLGFSVDEVKNQAMMRGAEGAVHQGDGTPIWVIPTDEEGWIARETASLIG